MIRFAFFTFPGTLLFSEAIYFHKIAPKWEGKKKLIFFKKYTIYWVKDKEMFLNIAKYKSEFFRKPNFNTGFHLCRVTYETASALLKKR